MRRPVSARKNTASSHDPTPILPVADAASGFADAVIAWQAEHGRHGLPWQQQRDAYRVWLSEVMLQQTQVATVIPYYQRFTKRFASVVALADADQALVMELWSGLGYYSRARNLHRCAQLVRDLHDGRFPDSLEALMALPGIGRSTAAAIAVFAFGRRAAILDGNVKRVFCRHFSIDGVLNSSQTERLLWARAEQELPTTDLVAYTQGMMDLGATCCTRTKPTCARCPVAHSCTALASDMVDQLPLRRRPRKLEQRNTTMLVLTRGSGAARQVWLQRRPDAGIWGGLLSLPESRLAAAEGISAHLRDAGIEDGALTVQEPGCAIEPSIWPPIDHTFTHFKLSIQPLVLSVESLPGLRLSEQGWLDLGRVDGAALPAPVKKFLSLLRQGRP